MRGDQRLLQGNKLTAKQEVVSQRNFQGKWKQIFIWDCTVDGVKATGEQGKR